MVVLPAFDLQAKGSISIAIKGEMGDNKKEYIRYSAHFVQPVSKRIKV